MADMEIVFRRTCNYWIDAGIVGLYDTFNKPVPNNREIGGWPKTIKNYSKVETTITADRLTIKGEESQIDLALSLSLEWTRTTLYDVSTEKQIASPEQNKRIKRMSTVAGELVASGKQAAHTYFRQKVIKSIGKENIFLPLKRKKTRAISTCIFCGQRTDTKLAHKEATELFIGETKRSTPFVEGISSNRCFHSFHIGSQKCWQCGYVTFFSPLLLFYRRFPLSRDKKDTYYLLPYIPGNLYATHKLYRTLSGKRGLARVVGADHININYESCFEQMPVGLPAFTLSFYFDLFERLLPRTYSGLLRASCDVGLVDERGAVFQTAFFLKRDSGKKSFILRETTIDRSAYFIKLFAYLKKYLDASKDGRVLYGLRALIRRASGKKSHHLQRLSVIKAAQAFTEGKPVYRFLLPILSTELRGDTAPPYEASSLVGLLGTYDQWLFKRREGNMANIVERAKTAGWHLSQRLWDKENKWDSKEKENLVKRYYYGIERAPSPVKFLEQARHAYKKVKEDIPKEMEFHEENDKGEIKENIKKYEVYRVYFLAGMLNGLLNKSKSDAPEQNKNEED